MNNQNNNKNFINLDPKLLTLSQIKDLEKVLNKIPKEDFGMNKNDLIKNLVKFMKPESAYKEFLKFLINDRNANSALLLIKNENLDKNLFEKNTTFTCLK